MEPAEAQRKSQEGNPASSKLWVAVKPKALVTVAVMLDVVLARTRGGAVHTIRLVEEPWVGVASEPVVALHANDRELDCGSRALTSKVTVWPEEPEVADW